MPATLLLLLLAVLGVVCFVVVAVYDTGAYTSCLLTYLTCLTIPLPYFLAAFVNCMYLYCASVVRTRACNQDYLPLPAMSWAGKRPSHDTTRARKRCPRPAGFRSRSCAWERKSERGSERLSQVPLGSSRTMTPLTAHIFLINVGFHQRNLMQAELLNSCGGAAEYTAGCIANRFPILNFLLYLAFLFAVAGLSPITESLQRIGLLVH
ncbi:hypothetical protein GGS21DRAFT_534105 [Xylaria nigripes]|nr:hypothetical protein GGS21DRAFT_534105 [Xylaria nigripes]